MSKFLPFYGVRPQEWLIPELMQKQFDQVIIEHCGDIDPAHVNEKILQSDFDEFFKNSMQYFFKVGIGYRKLLETGLLKEEEKPCYYMFGVNWDGHWIYCLTGAVHYSEYWNDKILRHENTLEDNEIELIHITESIDFNFNPIMLTYDPSKEIDDIIDDIAQSKWTYQYVGHNGHEHRFWVINSDSQTEELRKGFAKIDKAYIADGHHRIESGSKLAKMRNEKGNSPHEAPHNFFIANYFSRHHLRMYEFNRMVTDLHNHTATEFLDKLKCDFEVVDLGQEVFRPIEKQQFGMYLDGKWFQLKLRDATILPIDPVMQLDVSILKHLILKPILGIENARKGNRIVYADGTRSIDYLIEKVDNGEMQVAFTLCPANVDELVAIAEENLTMPPKATCIEPKIKSGIISRRLS